MADAEARGWGNPGKPGSAQEAKYKRDHLVWVVLNCGVRLYLRREVAPLIKGFWDELEELTGYSLADQGVPDDWGFANRPNRNNPNVLSNHAWGLAADGNSEENPNTHDGKIHTDLPVDVVRRLAAKYGLRWGGDYSGKTRDPMHVEFVGTPNQARALVVELGLDKPKVTEQSHADPIVLEDDMLPTIYTPVDDSGSAVDPATKKAYAPQVLVLGNKRKYLVSMEQRNRWIAAGARTVDKAYRDQIADIADLTEPV